MSVYQFVYSEPDKDEEGFGSAEPFLNIQGDDIKACVSNFFQFWELRDAKPVERLILSITLITK